MLSDNPSYADSTLIHRKMRELVITNYINQNIKRLGKCIIIKKCVIIPNQTTKKIEFVISKASLH